MHNIKRLIAFVRNRFKKIDFENYDPVDCIKDDVIYLKPGIRVTLLDPGEYENLKREHLKKAYPIN